MSDTLLSVKDLVIHYETEDEVVEAVNNISFDIKKGEVLGLVGETGAGKTTTALGILGLLPAKVGHVIQGSIEMEGRDLLKLSEKEMRQIRGKKISMIFQDPMTALNPVKTVGDQIAEVVLLHNHCSKAEALKRAQEMLAMVGIVPERYRDYPHQFSGGMKQRIVIAIALACEPKVLIADEPTTALDVTIQAQVLALMEELRDKLGMSMIMITHDLGIVAETCDKVAVMYAGEIIEMGSLVDIFEGEKHHPYTVGLFNAIPNLEEETERLKPIDGMMPDPADLPPGCNFAPRCPYATEACSAATPEPVEVSPGHTIACIRFREG